MPENRYSGSAPPIQPIQSNAPQIFESLASRLSAFSSRQEDELDRQMAKKAKEKGLIDAQGKTAITLRDGNTIADEAWNEGAVTSHMAAVKLDLTENLTRIKAESTRDPVAYETRAKAYTAGIVENLDPRLRPHVQDEVASAVLADKLAIQADLTSFKRDQQSAEIDTAIDLYETEAQNKAVLGDFAGSTEAHLKAVSLINSAELSGLKKPKDAETRRRLLNRGIETEIIKGEFGRQAADGNARKFIESFRRQKEVSDFTPEERRNLESEMVGMLSKSHALEDDQRKQEEELRKERYRKSEKDIVSLDLAGQLTPEFLKEGVANGTIDPKTADKFKRNAQLEGPEFSDAVAINHYKADILSFSELEIRTDPLLSRPDRDNLIVERRKLEADKGNWRRTQEGTEGARRINEAFGIIKGVDTRVTEEKAKRAGAVLTRFYNEVQSLPIGQREAKAIEVADMLVKEVNGEIQSDELKKARQRLIDFKYQTTEEIDAAELGVKEAKTMKTQLERLQKKIKRLEVSGE